MISGETKHSFHTVTNHHVSNTQQGDENESLVDSGHPLRLLDAMDWRVRVEIRHLIKIVYLPNWTNSSQTIDFWHIDSRERRGSINQIGSFTVCFLISTSTLTDLFLAINSVFNYETIFSRASTSLAQSIKSSSHSSSSVSLQRLPCSFVTYALLGSYTAQAELGDHSEIDHGTTFEYLKDLQFAPIQDDELLRRIYEQHKRHR